MRFSINLMNHALEGQRSLEDVVGIFGKQLRALGHEVVWDPRNDKMLTGPNEMNIIVEGFTAANAEIYRQLHAQGARYLILATEEPTERGFNHETQGEMAKRFEDFPLVGRLASGIFHLVPGEHVERYYSQFAPAASIELGYAADLVRNPYAIGAAREPKFEFGFYGSLSNRRLKILKRLANMTNRKHAVRIVADFATQHERDCAMAEAKVILQIRKFDKMGLVSSSRCNTALCIGRPVLAEPHELSHPWDEVVTFTKTLDGFYNQALLMRANWRGAHAAQFDRFKSIMTPQRCVGDALEKTGLLERAAA